MNKKILSRAKKIKLLAMDVDGVLTPGEIIILNSGEEVKIWSVKDRLGFALIKLCGSPVKLAWITARESKQVAERANEIGIHFLYQNCLDKWQALETCARSLGLTREEVAYIGDDFVDLKPLRNAGLSACPPESHALVRKACHYRTKASSGRGVAREVIEILLQAQGFWKKALSHFSLFLLFAWIAVFSACSTAVPPKQSVEKPDQWIEHFTITETRSGVPVWILNSENAQIYNKQKKALLDNIAIQFMNPANGKTDSQKSLHLAKKRQTQAARLFAPKGEVRLDDHNLKTWGGVEVRSEDGTTLYSEQLLYSTSQQKILSQSPIKIVRKDSILIGEGLEASPDLSTVKILRHQASIYPKEIIK